MLPPLPKGEVVNSFVLRVLQYTDDVSMTTACRQILERKPGLDGMPRGMETFFEQIGHKYYDDVDTTIHMHTHINYYLRGLPLTRREAQLMRIRKNLGGPTRLVRLPATCSVADGAAWECPDCVAEQISSLGFSYITREAQLPFMIVCHTHGTALRHPREQLRLFDNECAVPLTTARAAVHQELGKMAAYCLEHGPEDHYDKDEVLKSLQEAGWISENGRCHLADFVQTFALSHSDIFADARLNYLCSSLPEIEHAMRSLLRTDRALHPLWCLLFARFARMHQRPLPPRAAPKERARRPTVTPSRDEIEKERAKHSSLKATAEALNTNINRLAALCKRYGIPFTSRRKHVDEGLEQEVLRAVGDSSYSLEIDQGPGPVSTSTLYRILMAHPEVPTPGRLQLDARTKTAKVEWMRLMTAYPRKSMTALRKMSPAIWKQLYYNANDWLQANRPAPQPRVNAPKRKPPRAMLKKMLQASKASIDGNRTPGIKPIRQSEYRVRMNTGISEYTARKHLIPEMLEVGMLRAEKARVFARRRLKWAFPDGIPANEMPWFIAKKAGLRESSAKQAMTRIERASLKKGSEQKKGNRKA